LGALLIAGATVVLFSIAENRTRPDLERYIVARRALAVGTHIAAADLSTAPMHVAATPLRGRLFLSGRALVGAVVIAPVAPGELVQASAVVTADSLTTERQISVPIEAARALGDRLRVGELVDVVATYGTGGDAFTVTVVRAARVIARDSGGGPLGDRKSQVIVLGIDNGDDAMAIAHAVAAGEISLVRVTGAPSDLATPPPYRAPRPTASR
jgi:Flp pilus assembly protein CpaB